MSDQEEHEAYPWFFGKTDEEAAREFRVSLARQMASGLRITARISEAPDKGTVVSVEAREFPAFISPQSGRSTGGGYEAFDPHDPNSVMELQRQGIVALRAWLSRYQGAFEGQGTSLKPIEGILSEAGWRLARSA